MKQRVYIETSVISYLTARPSNDFRAMSNQIVTLEWWELERPKFELVISEFVIAEASLGHPEAAHRRLAAISSLVELQATQAVEALGRELITRNALPAAAAIDALHVAIAAVNGIEYLLTWNCTHIANAYTRPKIETTCRALGYEPPIICTPQELTEN
jgi:predicted nucleic acid-binding protein